MFCSLLCFLLSLCFTYVFTLCTCLLVCLCIFYCCPGSDLLYFGSVFFRCLTSLANKSKVGISLHAAKAFLEREDQRSVALIHLQDDTPANILPTNKSCTKVISCTFLQQSSWSGQTWLSVCVHGCCRQAQRSHRRISLPAKSLCGERIEFENKEKVGTATRGTTFGSWITDNSQTSTFCFRVNYILFYYFYFADN